LHDHCLELDFALGNIVYFDLVFVLAHTCQFVVHPIEKDQLVQSLVVDEVQKDLGYRRILVNSGDLELALEDLQFLDHFANNILLFGEHIFPEVDD